MPISIKEATECKAKLIEGLVETLSLLKGYSGTKSLLVKNLTELDNIIETICDIEILIDKCKSTTKVSDSETIMDIEHYVSSIDRKLEVLYVVLELDLDVHGVLDSIRKYEEIRDSIHRDLEYWYSKSML